MLKTPAPVSNLERQRKFRERNPGYFKKYRRRHQPSIAIAQVTAEATATELESHKPQLTINIPSSSASNAIASTNISEAQACEEQLM